MRQGHEKTVSDGKNFTDLIARRWWTTTSHGHILAFTRAELAMLFQNGRSTHGAESVFNCWIRTLSGVHWGHRPWSHPLHS